MHRRLVPPFRARPELSARSTGPFRVPVGTATVVALAVAAALGGPAQGAVHERGARSGPAPVDPAASVAGVPPALAAYVTGDRTDAQWGLAATHLRAAWTASTGQGVVVAVVDTGIDRTHPDLAGRIVSPAYLHPVSEQVVPGHEPDRNGHGTHVAGVIAARADGHGITGVAPGARVMPIDIDTTFEVGGVHVARAVRYAVAHGARVVNLSLGQADIPVTARDVAPVCAAVRDAVRAGVVVVAAAGNDGTGLNLREAPATCPGAVSVAAVTHRLQPAVWSSFDAGVSVAAPGDDVYSTVPRFVSRTGYASMSGTSMATPFVAGVAALVLARRPALTPGQVRVLLQRTATDVAPSGTDPRTGWGVVDPAAALGVAAPRVAAVPHLTVGAVPFPGRVGPDDSPVFDSTYVNWIPDPALAVTGYRVTRYGSDGVTTTDLSPTQVRHVDPVSEGGWTVTALTRTGEVRSAPVWSSADDPGRPPSTAVQAPRALRAVWTATGALVVSWRNPPGNAGRADRWSLYVGEEPVRGNERPGRLPNRVVLGADELPEGDFRVSLVLGSTRDQTDAEATVLRTARLPLSGRAAAAGPRRYRLYLTLAPSWARRACGASRCPGTALLVTTAGGLRYRTWLDSTGGVTVTVRAAPGARRLTVAVRAVERRRRVLDMPAPGRPRLSLRVA